MEFRTLLRMADKPQAVEVGLQAAKRLGTRAANVVSEMLKRFGVERKLKIALTQVAIGPQDNKVVDAAGAPAQLQARIHEEKLKNA